MRHFVIEAEWDAESNSWIASWSGEDAFLVTEGESKAALEANVSDALEALLESLDFIFEIRYR